MTKVKKLCEVGLDSFVRKIIKGNDPSRELRKRLVEVTSRNDQFINFISDNIGFNGVIDIDLTGHHKFNEQQFRSPSENEEKAIYNLNMDCTPLQATCPDYWGSITLGLIEKGVIKSRFLAAQPNDSKKRQLTGGYRIDHALKTGNFDDLSRFILRSFMGHEKIRNTGYRDYYQFCPVSRAWWRTRLAQTASRLNGFKRADVHQKLTNKGIWHHLSERGVSKLTVISDVNIFSGLTHYLVSKDIVSQKDCEQITAFLGAQTTWRILGAFEPIQISSIISSYRN